MPGAWCLCQGRSGGLSRRPVMCPLAVSRREVLIKADRSVLVRIQLDSPVLACQTDGSSMSDVVDGGKQRAVSSERFSFEPPMAPMGCRLGVARAADLDDERRPLLPPASAPPPPPSHLGPTHVSSVACLLPYLRARYHSSMATITTD